LIIARQISGAFLGSNYQHLRRDRILFSDTPTSCVPPSFLVGISSMSLFDSTTNGRERLSTRRFVGTFLFIKPVLI
jgi:hypothetical protein